MEKIYISLGADCGSAGVFRASGKKTFSFPFDWVVSFHSIHKVFQNDFRGLLEDRVMNTELQGNANEFNVEYNIRFFHRELIKDYDNTLKRRLDRLINLLNSTDKELIFLRRSHDQKHHNEIKYCGLSAPDEIDDVQDMRMLRDILVEKYPKLNFKLNLFLQCPLCNKDQQNFEDKHLSIIKTTHMDTTGDFTKSRDLCENEFLEWAKTL